MIFFVIGLIVLMVLGWIIQMVVFTRRSTGPKNLPAIRITNNTLIEASCPSSYCSKCGNSFGNGNFCACCGTPRIAKQRLDIPIQGSINSTDFEECLNEWLAENPYVTDLELHMETKNSLYGLIPSKKFKVKSAYVEYRVGSVPNNYQYGISFLYNCRLFGNWGFNYKKLYKKWSENNPDCTILSTHGTGKILHWGDSNYVEYYSYILFAKML